MQFDFKRKYIYFKHTVAFKCHTSDIYGVTAPVATKQFSRNYCRWRLTFKARRIAAAKNEFNRSSIILVSN